MGEVGWVDGCKNEGTGVWIMDGWVSGWIDGWVSVADGQRNRSIGG